MRIPANIKDKVPPFMRNKYLLSIILFLLWIIFLDSNNLISRYKELKYLKKLKTDREYYLARIKEDRSKLEELKTGNRNLEKFAREQYHMKRPDEDLYIVLTPQENRRAERRMH
ncbi:MAG: septum formation initiator family protein [Bacteroidales bacterium]|nr:septum formation initiator family protein [Bacteroidales bacterium]